MSRWSVGRLLLGICALGGWAGLVSPARSAEPERVRFDTVDGVEIHGTYYSPPNPGPKTPCAIVLHSVGGSSQQEGYDELAKKLLSKNYCVLLFDFRGHGGSTTVNNLFWQDSANAGIRTARKTKDQISFKDFKTLNHFAMMVNDISAAKRFLDRKNDGNECNSANTFVIGAESGAALGALWVRTEWDHARIMIGVPQFNTGRTWHGGEHRPRLWA